MPLKACNARLIIDGFDVSGQSNSMSITLDVPPLDYDVFQTCTTLREAGTPTSMLEHSGYMYDVTAGYLEYELQSRLGSETPMWVAAVPDDTLTVAPAYVFDSTYATNFKVDTPVKELVTLSGKWPTGTNPTARGYIVFDGQIDATGTTTAVDFGAAGTTGGTVYLFVRAVDGTATSADVVVESAPTADGTYATEATVTFSATAPKAATAAMSGAISRYLRVNCTDLGGATSFDVTVIACVNDVTQ
jgi:hypothetical protein